MDDEQLMKYLNVSGEAATQWVRELPASKRAVYVRMADVEMELKLWQAGLDPKPTGVLFDFDKRKSP